MFWSIPSETSFIDYPEDLIHGLANMYATIASNIRDDSRVYRSMSEALDWLEVEPIRHKIESLTSEEAYQQRTASTDNQA